MTRPCGPGGSVGPPTTQRWFLFSIVQRESNAGGSEGRSDLWLELSTLRLECSSLDRVHWSNQSTFRVPSGDPEAEMGG